MRIDVDSLKESEHSGSEESVNQKLGEIGELQEANFVVRERIAILQHKIPRIEREFGGKGEDLGGTI